LNNWMNMQPWGQQWGWDDWDNDDDWDNSNNWDPWGWRRPRRRRRRRFFPPIFRPPFGKGGKGFPWGQGGGY